MQESDYDIIKFKYKQILHYPWQITFFGRHDSIGLIQMKTLKDVKNKVFRSHNNFPIISLLYAVPAKRQLSNDLNCQPFVGIH